MHTAVTESYRYIFDLAGESIYNICAPSQSDCGVRR